MNVKELRSVLQELQGILAAANAKGQSKDVAAFVEILDGADEMPVECFLKDLERRLAERDPPAVVGPRPADPVVVERHLSGLRAANTDRAVFEAQLDVLKRDQAVGKAEAETIAFEYVGYSGGRKSWPNKKAAIQAIEEWFSQLAYDAVRSKQLEKARYAG